MRRFRRHREEELEEEIASHLHMAIQDRIEQGATPAEAGHAARREFGNGDLVRESVRRVWGGMWLDRLLQDLRFGARMMRRNPGFSAAVVITLAFGIGANIAVFHLWNAVDLRPLPVDKPEELVQVIGKQNGLPQAFSYPWIRDAAMKLHSVQGIAGSGGLPVNEIAVDGRVLTERVEGNVVTGAYFRVLGVPAQLGRIFTEADDRASAPPVAVLSDRFWRREFGAQTDAIGRTFTVNNLRVTVIGVAPPEFFGETIGRAPDLWIPMNMGPQLGMGWMLEPYTAWIEPLARLRPGVRREQAQAELNVLYAVSRHLTLRRGGAVDFRVELKPIGNGRNRFETLSSPLRLLMGIAGFVILIACCNLAGLFLARSAARTHEMGVRLATGATRSRLVRQMLTESLMLAAIGGSIGFLLGTWGSRGLVALATTGSVLRLYPNVDSRVVLFAASLTIASACLFGLAPICSGARKTLNSALSAGLRTHTGRFEHRLARGFVVAQLSISLVLVAGGLLLVRSFWNLFNQDWGYEKSHILEIDFAFEPDVIGKLHSEDYRRLLLGKLSAIPGVFSAAAASEGPLAGVRQDGKFSTLERPAHSGDKLYYVQVSSRYFETMTIPILSGRPITEQDMHRSAQVAVISETAAKKFFGDANPIGRSFTNGDYFVSAAAIRVVGIARDLHHQDPREPFLPLVFRPLNQGRFVSPPSWFVRTHDDPASTIPAVRAAVKELDHNLHIDRVHPWKEVIVSKVREERMLAWIAGGFGVLALVLACVGIYGVVSFGVNRRTRETGVKLALGATRGQVRGFFLREAAVLWLVSIVIGGVCAFVLLRWTRSVLFGLTPYDPTMLVSALLLLGAVTLAGAYLPARRAACLDPMNALRQE